MKQKHVLLLITPSSPGRFAGIAAYAKTHGWHLTVADRLTHAFDGWTGDGALVTLRDDERTIRYVRSLRRRRIPVVDLSCTRPEIKLPRVSADNAAIGRAAAEHFHDRNYRHTAWYSTTYGYQHDLRAEAFRGDERWVWTESDNAALSDDWRSLSKWLAELLKKAPKPLGVFCYDDADASRVESVALASGFSIPEDVAILGAGNDIPLCEAQTIPISSVRHDLMRNGTEGASLLDRLMNGEATARSFHLALPPDGVAERASTDAFATSDPIVRRALDIYLSDLARPPSTVMLAERLGISRATLDRAFAADTGLSPAKMLMKLRLAEAKRLIREDQLSLTEISARLGFCNPAYFTNAFRLSFGHPPRDERRACN